MGAQHYRWMPKLSFSSSGAAAKPRVEGRTGRFAAPGGSA
jgi:hypothetical protein